MNERDLLPLDAGEGHRTPTSGGDRLMLLLAAVALIGGVSIAIGNLIPPSDDEITMASATPSATGVPSRTPRPSPTPRPLGQILVTPAEPPPSGPTDWWIQEWIRPLQDLPIRTAPATDAPATGLAAAGELVLVEQSDGNLGAPGWRYKGDGDSPGWIQVEAGGAQLAERYPTDPGTWVRLYAEVESGDGGFVAAGNGTFATSSNGVSWVQRDAPAGQGTGQYGIAWGPAGWLAVSWGYGGRLPTAPYVWQSDGSQEWVGIGEMATRRADIGFNGLWGSRLGYLMLTTSSGGQQSFWFSTNGIAWLEMPATGLAQSDAWLQVTPTAQGFYVAADASGGQSTTAGAVFTADGGTWLDVHGGPAHPLAFIAALGDRLVALDRDPQSDAARVLIGTIGRESVDWVGESRADATFAGTVPTALVSDTRRAVAMAWDRETEVVRAWTSLDGVAWTPLALPPDGFGVIPHQVLGSTAGIVVVGLANDDGIQTLQSWQLAGNLWHRSNLPAALGIDQPYGTPCPGAPRDVLEFIALDPGVAVHCFGDTPITFTAYSVPCLGCEGGGDDTLSPAWLAGGNPQMYLSPIATDSGGWLDIVLDPSLRPDPAWGGAWVQIVGHFDDPAAADCRQRVEPDVEQWYQGRQQLIEDCRRRFVITEVTVVDGP